MAYDMSLSTMIEHLRDDAVYFPFEQIRSYKFLLSQEQNVPMDSTLKQDYLSFFKDVKAQCTALLKSVPNHENAELWREAVEEINELI